MPGYPVPEVDKEIFQELLCEYCVTVVRDAWRAECGHFYCRSCVEFLFRLASLVNVNPCTPGIRTCGEFAGNFLSFEELKGCDFPKL